MQIFQKMEVTETKTELDDNSVNTKSIFTKKSISVIKCIIPVGAFSAASLTLNKPITGYQ